MRVDLPLDRKTVENQGWATGPQDRRATEPRGRRGPWAAGGWAFGPLGRRGPWTAGRWAAGLLLAKPHIAPRLHGKKTRLHTDAQKNP